MSENKKIKALKLEPIDVDLNELGRMMAQNLDTACAEYSSEHGGFANDEFVQQIFSALVFTLAGAANQMTYHGVGQTMTKEELMSDMMEKIAGSLLVATEAADKLVEGWEKATTCADRDCDCKRHSHDDDNSSFTK